MSDEASRIDPEVFYNFCLRVSFQSGRILYLCGPNDEKHLELNCVKKFLKNQNQCSKCNTLFYLVHATAKHSSKRVD
jgi:hypothetical protein